MFIENKNKTQQKNLFQKRAGKNIFWLRGGIQGCNSSSPGQCGKWRALIGQQVGFKSGKVE